MKLSLFMLLSLLSLAQCSLASRAQQGNTNHSTDKMETPSHPSQSHDQMSGMHSMADMMESMHPKTFIQEIKYHATSGTSAEPNSIPAPMLMTMKGDWMLMFHGNAFVLDIQQSNSARGRQVFLNELAYANGTAFSRSRTAYDACNVQH